MAKSSRRSASKRSKGAKKKAARKGAARKRAKAAPDRIELRGIRQFAEKHIALVDQHPSPGGKALQVRDRMQQLVDEIKSFCGPNMSVPLA